jgi:hypothetical protein
MSGCGNCGWPGARTIYKNDERLSGVGRREYVPFGVVVTYVDGLDPVPPPRPSGAIFLT